MASDALAFAPNHPGQVLVDLNARSSGFVRRHSRHQASRPETPPPKRPGNRWMWLVLALLAGGAAVAYLQPWSSLASQSASKVEDQSSAAPRTVTIDRPTAAAASSVALPATIHPWQTAELHARVSGYLKAWHHDLGSTVQAGELLAEIDTPELDQELAEGVALAREADAAVDQARAERIEAEADLKVAEAQLDRVRAEVELARSQLDRREKLLERRAISQEEFESFRRDLTVRTADVAAAEADVARRHTNLQTRTAIIAARLATANSRQASVDRLEELQTFKRIVAPFAGVITQRTAEVGMLITAGEGSLYVVEDMSRVRVQLHVPQAYSAQTRTGVAAQIHLPESTNPSVAGTITRTAESVEAQSRTMLAEVELDNAANHFQPGSYAQVTLLTPQSSSWTIPTNTVHMQVDGPHVVVVNDADEIEVRQVTLGRDLGARVVAVDGIRGDERLVVNPSDDLIGGLRVQIGETHAAEPVVAQR